VFFVSERERERERKRERERERERERKREKDRNLKREKTRERERKRERWKEEGKRERGNEATRQRGKEREVGQVWSVEIVDNDEGCQDLVQLSMSLPSSPPRRLVHRAHGTRRARGDGHSRGWAARPQVRPSPQPR
jgi:hypothetical protein